MATLRPLGVGSHILTHGDKMAGFYGEVNGIITADELRSMVGVSQGTPTQTGDITWLKFSHNYKTLYIAKQPIQHSISWDYLHERDLVFGKMVEIGGSVYLLRLLQGSNINPAPYYNGNTPPSSITSQNSEWDNTLVKVVNTWNLYSTLDIGNSTGGSLVQEVTEQSLNFRVLRGSRVNAIENLSNAGILVSGGSGTHTHWRPLLELIY